MKRPHRKFKRSIDKRYKNFGTWMKINSDMTGRTSRKSRLHDRKQRFDRRDNGCLWQ
jgi:hypothetical protein